MEKANNYDNKTSLLLIIDEIEKAIDAKLYLAALHMALSIPDMLGRLVYQKNNGKKNYIKWFDENVRNSIFGYLYSENPLITDEDFPKMSGEVCYALRCKLFHEGTDNIVAKTKARINEFVLSFDDSDSVRGNYAGKDYEFDKWNPETGEIPASNYLYVSCKGLSKEIVVAAKEFYNNNPDLNYQKLRINYGGGKVQSFWFAEENKSNNI